MLRTENVRYTIIAKPGVFFPVQYFSLVFRFELTLWASSPQGNPSNVCCLFSFTIDQSMRASLFAQPSSYGHPLILFWYYVVLCLNGHIYSKSMDQQGKVASPARGQLNRENIYSRSCLRIWSRWTGSAVPSRVSLLISILRLNLVLTYGISPARVPRRRPFIHL